MSSYQDFTFTAISGHDILAASDSNLNCGDSFTMGFSANVQMTVSDNDSRLSGDARRNEQGDDRRGQTAEIEVDGAVLHSGAKIYAEQVYVLTDANGGWHFLVEIEVAGAAGSDLDDFYAFLGDAPPAGAVLTVAGQFNVRGNWLKYRDLTGGLNWDLDGNGAVTVEAEDLALTNYRIDDVDAASNGEVIKLKRGEGEAGVTFGAESGVYDLAVAYIDENDGQGMIEVLLNGALIQTITLDQDDNGNGDDASTISTIVIESLNLNQGDAIVLRGARDGGEFARIDALTFTSAGTNTAPEANAEAASIAQGATLSLDLLSNDSDAEGDTLFITEAGGAPVGIEFSATSAGGRTALVTVSSAGVLTFAAASAAFSDLALGQQDFLSVAYTVTDAQGASSSATAAITIIGANDGPTVAGIVEASGAEGGPAFIVDLLQGANDVDDGATLSVQNLVLIDGDDKGATISGANVSIDTTQYENLSAGQTELLRYTYTIADEHGATVAQTAEISITGENDAPTVSGAVTAEATEDDAAFTVNLLDGAADPDESDTLTIANLTLISGDDSGVKLNGAVLEINPDAYDSLAANEFAVINYSYDVTDGNGGAVAQTAIITIDGLSDAPVALPGAATGDEDTPITGQVIAFDPDVNDTLSYSQQSQSLTGTAFVNSDGTFIWFPGNNGGNFSGEVVFDYRVIDSSGATDVGGITITVNPVNDTPDAANDSFIVAEGAVFSADLLANDDDIDIGDVLSITSANGFAAGSTFAVTSAAGRDGSVTVSANGAANLTFDQQGNFDDLAAGETDTVSINYAISDGNGGVDAADATITIVGAGPASASASASGATPNSGDAVEITLSGDSTTLDGTADLNVLISGGTVIDADLILFDDSAVFGTLIDTIEFDLPGSVDDPANPDLLSTGLGLELMLANVSGFANDLGDANRAALVVQFDDDNDDVVDLSLFAEIEIFGLA